MKAGKNPFRSAAIARLRYKMPKEKLEALAKDISSNGPRHSCIVGKEGTGKTTLLEDLEPHLQKQGLRTTWLKLTLESTHHQRKEALATVSALAESDCLLFDGGEVLNAFDWWHLKRSLRKSAGYLIATLHQQRNLPICHKTEPDLALAQSLVQELCEHDLEAIAKRAFEKSNGNMREVFRACYWACAKSY